MRNGGRSFQDASKEIQENLKKHLEKQDDGLLSDSDEESGDEEHESELISRLLGRYNGIDSEVVAGPSGGTVAKVSSHLQQLQL